MTDYDDHAEAIAAGEQMQVEADYQHELAITQHLEDLEREDEGRDQ